MALIGFVQIFLSIIFFLLIRCLRRNNNGLPKNLPIVGMLPQLLLNAHRIHDWSIEILERSQCTFIFKGPWFANMNFLSTVDPANIRYIFTTNFSNFPKGSEYNEIFDVLGDGIFNSDSDSWKIQRKAGRAMINHHSFYKFMVKIRMAKVEKGLIPVLDHLSKQCITVDLQDLFQRYTLDTTCKVVTGYDPGCLSIEFPEVPLSKALEDAEESLFYRHVVPRSFWKLQRWLGIGEELKMKKAKGTVDRILYEYIHRKREELREGTMTNEKEVDLLTSYMNEEKSLELNSDDKFLRDTILSLISAGRDTVGAALTWFFWLVSKDPQVETMIREEVNSIIPADKMGMKWFLFDFGDLNKLVYLHGACCEALRLYPPVPFLHKVPLTPDILPSGHQAVPKTKMFFPFYAMGRMKSIWGEDCLQFKPERWISENGRIRREPSFKFMPFSTGPRDCIGKEVAFTQMKTVAATIIHNYNIHVVEGQNIGPESSIVLHMKHGLMVSVSNRWAK